MIRDAILAQPLVAVFAVARPDGRVHATPLWFHWNGTAFEFIVERDSPRHRFSVAAGRAAVCIETLGPDQELEFVTAEGPVRVVDPLEPPVRYAMWERYVGSERAHAVVDRGGHETKVLLLLTPETWIPSR